MKYVNRIICFPLLLILLFGMIHFGSRTVEAATTLYWPVPGHTNISVGFHDNRAIDIADSNINGATVIAAIGGTVDGVFYCSKTHVGDIKCTQCYGYGTAVYIKGSDNRIYMYAHMQPDSIPGNIYPGAVVSACQTLGKVGNTGNSKGDHLHFAISYNTIYTQSGINPQNETYIYSSTPIENPDNLFDTRYPTPFKAFTLSRVNVECYNNINGSRAGDIWPDDECTILEIYTNGWCKLNCPWPSDPKGYKTVYTRTTAFLDPNYYVSEHNILTNANGCTRKDMANWYAEIPAGTHFWRIGKSGPGGYTQIIYHADGVGYRSMWITHPGDKIEGLNIGSDFYAYIINSAQWRHVTNDVDANHVSNATLRKENQTESQIWKFEYQGNGYYKIINCATGHVLEVYNGQDCDYGNVKTWEWYAGDSELWMICGVWNGIVTLEPKCSTRVLDVCDNSTQEGANVQIYTQNGTGAQLFHVWTDLERTVTYNANGGEGAPALQKAQYNTTITLSSQKPTKHGCTFLGWSTDSKATSATYKPNSNFTIKTSTTLYAVWKSDCSVAHKYGSWTVSKAATCTVKGSEQRECQTCGKTETREIAANGHNYKSVVTAPTCTDQGYTTHTCANCKDSYKDTYVNAKGHSYGSWTVTKAATCTAKGTETRKCTCGKTETREIAAKGHSYKAVVTAPTCTEKGYTTHTCASCNDSYKDTYVNAKGHIYETGTCKTCGAVDPDYVVTDAIYRITNAEGMAGSVVEIYVSVENNSGIVSLRSAVSYDESVLELVGIEDLKLLNGFTNPPAELTSPVTLRWADALATKNNTSNGKIVKLTFQIKEDAQPGSYEISVTHIEARNTEGQKLSFKEAKANITVLDYVAGDMDGDGEISDWDEILLSRYLAGWNVEILLVPADVDGDGEVSDWDAILLSRYLAGWNVTLGKE